MNLQRLLAEYRKISRRLSRRCLLASQRQLQSWKRRLAVLEQRIRLMGGRSLRRVSLAAALGGAVLLPQAALATAPTVSFSQQDPGLTLLPSTHLDKYTQVAFADVDGDGDLDAFAVSRNKHYVTFWQNTGNKQHPVFVDKTLDASANPMYGQTLYYSENYNGISIADVDGDGDPDIVVGNWNLQYFKNVGSPTHPAFQQQYGSDNPFYSLYSSNYAKPLLVDLDGDGDQDLIVAHYDTVEYFKNVGSRTAPDFQLQTGVHDPFNGMSLPGAGDLYVAAGDLDGDGDLDILLGSANSSPTQYYVYLWQNNGNKSAPKFESKGKVPNVMSMTTPISLVDYDGDGDLDLVSGNWYDGVQNWTNIGSSSHAVFNQPVTMYNAQYSMQFADVDSDGDIDQFAYNNTLNLDEGSHFSDYRYAPMNPFYSLSSDVKAFGDLDGDGGVDFVQFTGSNLHYFHEDGHPGSMNFNERTGSANPFNGLTSNISKGYAKLVDIDGDGDLDLVVSNYNSSAPIQFFLNDGTPTAPHFSATAGAGNPFSGLGNFLHSDLILEDVDGDGDMDFIAAGELGPGSGVKARRFFRNDTNGPGLPSFSWINGADDPFTATGGFSGTPVVVDFDQDGDKDILLFNWNSYSWTLLRNDTARFSKVDAIAQEKGHPLLGPVPAKSGDDVCVFVDKATDSMQVDLYNLAGELVQRGLSGVTASNACFKAKVAPGLYWAKITSGGRTFTQKIIISK